MLALISLFVIMTSSTVKKNISLNDAIKNTYVTVSMQGNEKSTHYYEPVAINLMNNSTTDLLLNLDVGTLLEPDNTKEQTLMVTEGLLVNLSPKQSKNLKIKAMCINPAKSAGSEKTKYSLKPNSDKTLIDIANFISKNKYFTSCGQSAVWTYIEKRNLREIYGADSIEQNKLRNYIHQVAGLPLPSKSDLDDYKYNYYVVPDPKITLSGYFQFGMYNPHNIQIAMFDTTGILVRELFNKKNYQPINGEKFNYSFDFTVYKDDKYFVKLIVDNEVIMTRTVSAKSIRDKYFEQMRN